MTKIKKFIIIQIKSRSKLKDDFGLFKSGQLFALLERWCWYFLLRYRDFKNYCSIGNPWFLINMDHQLCINKCSMHTKIKYINRWLSHMLNCPCNSLFYSSTIIHSKNRLHGTFIINELIFWLFNCDKNSVNWSIILIATWPK